MFDGRKIMIGVRVVAVLLKDDLVEGVVAIDGTRRFRLADQNAGINALRTRRCWTRLENYRYNFQNFNVIRFVCFEENMIIYKIIVKYNGEQNKKQLQSNLSIKTT